MLFEVINPAKREEMQREGGKEGTNPFFDLHNEPNRVYQMPMSFSELADFGSEGEKRQWMKKQ